MFDYYRRNLPHWQPKGEEYFITFRLAGTLPAESIARLKKKQKHFRLRYEASDYRLAFFQSTPRRGREDSIIAFTISGYQPGHPHRAQSGLCSL
jgi:hypothetical protein